ncbi:MAG: hypothetical protein IT298_06675 [Chloroflexi bacterium]|jgi:multisubunit Na+/H+ antiporter MnhF subunit|nr:MAG: Na(+)/H(+) antiporter subunit F [Chloroflexi bacterium OLB13]MBC6956681.1 hypothetical protein [Chloroflexota bacterium]MBV6436920.1 hypothetical protein [Anaerolineae bacterium]MDL1916410.1 hypothetical protein [Anaerolineae bacterium CFX4]OQY80605.1 MAG: hypothetical protein B6D42_12835 [Anaerolineae bacterium UTCFX5]
MAEMRGLFDLILIVMVALLVCVATRVFRGRTPVDRLQASDLISTLVMAIVAVVGLAQQSTMLIDLGIALAAFSFIGTLAIARFIGDGKVF